MQKVYKKRIKDTDELRARILTARNEMNQRTIDKAVRQWRARLRVCIKAKGGHFQHTLSQWCVFANVTALTILDICANVCLFKSCTIKTKGSRNYKSPGPPRG